MMRRTVARLYEPLHGQARRDSSDSGQSSECRQIIDCVPLLLCQAAMGCPVVVAGSASAMTCVFSHAWTQWCQSSSEEPGIKRKFKDLMENCGDGSGRTRIGIVFRGLALADEVGEIP